MPADNASNGNSATFAPIVRCDLLTCSRPAFEETLAKFEAKRQELESAGDLPNVPVLADGAQLITPMIAEMLLLLSAGNRAIDLRTVRAYAADMKRGDWQLTGETINILAGKLRNGHHRLWACLLGLVAFHCYVIMSVDEFPNAFAYFDSGKRRTAADALFTAGWNGAGKVIADTINQLSYRYDHNALPAIGHKAPRGFGPLNNREVLAYLVAHPDLQNAADIVLGTYQETIKVIRSKPAAVQFGWLVIKHHGLPALDEFFGPLGSGANLTEDSSTLALRGKLMEVIDGKLAKLSSKDCLAYLIKAYNMHRAGLKMSRYRGKVVPLVLAHGERYPRIEPEPASTTAAPDAA